MPRWGRPPGASKGKKRRDWEREREREQRRMWEEEERRFEELQTEDDEQGVFLDNYVHPHRFASDELRFTGIDLSPAREDGLGPGDGTASGSSAVDDDDGSDGRDHEAMQMQVTLRDKEEMLAQTAVERMQRARTKGQPTVTLTQPELDALLRKQKASAIPSRQSPEESTSSGGSGSDHRKGDPDHVSIAPSASLAKARRRRAKSGAYFAEALPASSSSSIPLASPSRSASVYQKKSHKSQPPQNQHPSEQSRYFSVPEGVERPGSQQVRSPRASSQRPPLPHEPGWTPRPRARSSAGQSGRPTDPFQYQSYPSPPPPLPPQYMTQSRRNASGPAEVQYGSGRRPPRNFSYPQGSTLPTSTSDPAMARRSAVVVDTESDEPDSGDDEDGDDDDGDSGVRVISKPRGWDDRRRPGGREQFRRRR